MHLWVSASVRLEPRCCSSLSLGEPLGLRPEGSAPCSFSDRQAAAKALASFEENQVPEVTTPAFDFDVWPEFNGCPVKSVFLLARPTASQVAPASRAILEHLVAGLEAAMDIARLLRFSKASGSAKALDNQFDFRGGCWASPLQKP